MVKDVHSLLLLLLLLLLLFIKLYYLTYLNDNKLHQNSSSLQLVMEACESLHSHLPKYFYHPHPHISSFTVKLKEYLNMIYVESRCVNFPATVTNIRSHVAKGLVDDLIKECGR
jgi:16S rRNA A1518/A1519 N6-dimethyltransferase RsmA/KsgA/DIM1 with predicted DNA glycosylase/AP lyase activity